MLNTEILFLALKNSRTLVTWHNFGYHIDIGIEKLVSRVEKAKFKEIIIAVKPTIEGETTSLYIKKILETNWCQDSITN